MLKLTENAPTKRKFEIIQLVINASPTKLSYSPDLNKLKNEASTPEQKNLLKKLSKIPVNLVPPRTNKRNSIGVKEDKKNNKKNKKHSRATPDDIRVGLPF